MKMLRMLAAAALLSLLGALPARAAWVKAETDRFVVYGNVADFLVKDVAVRLTAYDATLRVFYPPAAKATPQKLTVYLVRSRKELQRVNPKINADYAGFYTAGPQAVFAIASLEQGPAHLETLFHEYAHYYMLEYFPGAYPGWFVEGWAEYFMTADIQPRAVVVGGFNEGRTSWLLNYSWLPLKDILTHNASDLSDSVAGQLYYGEAWLLTHYMLSDPVRAGQLDRMTVAIANGAEPVKALQDATGMTLDQLLPALREHLRQPRMRQVKDVLKAAPAIALTPMPASADDLLLESLRLAESQGANPDPGLLAEIRAKAARYPGDKLAELTLAQAEFVHGDIAKGEAILDKRLAADANDLDALTQAGLGQMAAARREPARRAERYRAARPFFARAYQLNKDDYRTLYGYALSRTGEPGFPTDNDVHALLEARLLAPPVPDTAILAGYALLVRHDPEDAKKVLAPVANNPHGGFAAAQAKALMKAHSQAEVEAAANAEGGDDE